MSTNRRDLFKPSPVPGAMLNVVLGWIGLGLIVSIIFSIDSSEGFWQTFSGIYGLFCCGIGSVVLNLAAWLERNAGAKFALGLGSLGILLLTFLMTFSSMVIFGGLQTAAAAFIFLSPFFVIYSIPATMGGIRLFNKWGGATEADQLAKLHTLVGKNDGMVTYQQVADELDMPLDAVDPLLRRYIATKENKGESLSKYERFYTEEAKRKQELLILGKIDTQGTVFVEDIGLEFDLPIELVKEMIYALVERDRFTGYVNWDEGKLYSAAASKIKEDSLCPNCNGKLSIAGKHVIQCDFCGVEVFLANE